MNRLFKIFAICLCQLVLYAHAGQAADYLLKLSVTPSAAGYIYDNAIRTVTAGENVYIETYRYNENYKFLHWITATGEVVSDKSYFYYTMPEADTELTAVYQFSPQSPANPESAENAYKLTLQSVPTNAGSFNWTNGKKVKSGETVELYAYVNNSHYKFREWQVNGERIGSDQWLQYTMPSENTLLTAIYDFAPVSPGNPGANGYNAQSGEVVLDDFQSGNASSALYQVTNGNYDKVTSIIIAGKADNYDAGIVNQCPKCTDLDMSRTNISILPYWIFEGNTHLTTVSLPASLSRIEYAAFSGCENLTALNLYSVTPPILDSYAFDGLNKENVIVYVPVASIPLYKEASGWKDMTIEPLRSQISSLEVNLPEGINAQVYKGMYIELFNKSSEQTVRYVITDRVTYTFNSLPHNSEYNVYLKNKQGVVLGEILDVKVDDKDVSKTFENLKELKTLTLKVLTPAGEDVTASTTITWSNNGEFLANGNSLAGQIEGDSATYRITLPQALAMQYLQPTEVKYEVQATNAIVYPLTPLSKKNISGKVVDTQSGEAIGGAAVSVSQTINGIYSKSFTTKTDAEGLWSLNDVFDAPTEITASASNYVNKTQSFTTLATVIPTFELKDINGTKINLNLTYQATGSEEIQDYYEDYANVSYTVYDATGTQITDMNVQYPQIVLTESLAEGTQLTVIATSKNAKFAEVTASATVNAKDIAEVNLLIKQYGSMKATYGSSENNNIVGILYDGNGRLLKKYDYVNAELTISELPDGKYTLVTMGNSALFNSVYNLSQFTSVGLKARVDYLRNAFTVKSGEVTAFNNDKIPYLDETKLYYTGKYTSVVVNKESVTAGQYLTISGRVDFKSVYSDNVSNVNLIFDLPNETKFVEQSVMAGNSQTSYEYNADAHRLTVPVGNTADRIRFCFVPTAGGSYAPAASVQFTLNDKVITQPIGSVSYTVKDLSISVPSTTASTTVPVSGTAVGKSKVEIYDNGTLVGQTTSLANGSWATTVELNNAYNMSSHEIFAKLTSSDGTVMQSESQQTVYNKNAIQVSKVTMYYSNPEENWWKGKNYELVFDFQNPSTTRQRYTYYIYNRTFTFTVDFTANDPERISNVVLYVKTGDGKWHALNPTFDAKRKQWVVSSEFGNMYDGIVPVNFSVDYSFTSDDAVDMSAAFLSESNEIELAGQVSGLAAKLMTAEKKDDNTFSIGINNAPLFDVAVEALDFTTASAMLAQQQFSFAKLDDNSYFCVSDKLAKDKYVVTIVDTKNQRALRMTFTSDQFQEVVAFASAGDTKTLINLFKKQGTSWLTKYLGVFANLISKKVSTESAGFSTTLEMLSSYVDHDLTLRALIIKAISSKCKNGTYRLSDEDRVAFASQLTTIENSAALFHQAFLNYLKAYQIALLNAMCYNIGVTAATASIGEKSALVLPEEDAFYFTTTLPFSYQWTAKRLESMLLAATCLIQGHTTAILPGTGLPEGVLAFSEWAPKKNAELMKLYGTLLTSIKAKYSKCPSDDDDTGNHDTPHPDMDVPIDPSGYVYEAVPSNRIPGVTATIYYKETVEDMYGNKEDKVVLWDAAEYAQENPLFTDENGMYRWDVPQGLWQVKFEKEGYQPTESEWLPVPPPQLDVNIAMTQLSQPAVKSVKASDKFVDIEFDKYMDISTLTQAAGNIKVVRNGKNVNGGVELLNAEAISEGNAQSYASKVRFTIPEGQELLTVDDVELVIKKDVKSYAGIVMQSDYSQNLTVEPLVRSIVADEQVKVKYGSYKTITIGVLPADASKNKKLYVKPLSSMIASVAAEELTLDENGQAVITVNGDLPGSTMLMYSVEGSDIQGQTTVNVLEAALMETMAPQASRVSGSELYRGAEITLTSETNDAEIYYTLDGETCPCEIDKAIKYEAPIVINDDKIVIKAFAKAKDLEDSEVVEFTYTLKKTTVGLNLAQGWSWISHNVEEDIPVSQLGNNVEMIKSQTEQAMSITGKEGLFGRLKTLKPTELYKIKMKAADDNTLNGYEFNARDKNVPIEAGWNWIGYPLSQTMTLNEALAFFTPQDGDVIVGQDGSAEYTNGEWNGTLEGMDQGKGYLYKSAVKTEIPFNTSIVSNARSLIFMRSMLIGSPWAPDKHAYPNVMPVTAELYDHGMKTADKEIFVGAFAGTECRGVGQWKNGRLLITVYGQGGEEITFRAFNTVSEQEYGLKETVVFDGEIHGQWNAPIALNMGSDLTSINQTQSQFQVTPAVFGDHITVSADGRQISHFSLTDMGGRKVVSLYDLGSGATITTGQLPEGMYIATLVVEGETYYKKIVKANK